MRSSYRRGFSAIEALLIMGFIVLLIGTSWYIWHQRHNSAPATSTTSSSSAASTAKYLVVKEAKVKFQLSDAIRDAYYYADPHDTTGQTVSFSTRSLDKLSIEACRAQPTTGANSGTLSGAATLYIHAPPATPTRSSPYETRIGDNLYLIVANADCYKSDAAIAAKIRTIQDAFVAASSTITSSH